MRIFKSALDAFKALKVEAHTVLSAPVPCLWRCVWRIYTPVNNSFAIRSWNNGADAVTVIRREEKLAEGKTMGSLS